MKWFFDMNNPVMRTLSTLADIVVLNLLTLLCALPVITGGAALTALYEERYQQFRRIYPAVKALFPVIQ